MVASRFSDKRHSVASPFDLAFHAAPLFFEWGILAESATMFVEGVIVATQQFWMSFVSILGAIPRYD
jgi:hypothetical protein